MADPVLDVRDLSTHLFVDAGRVRAVDEVSLRVMPGEAVALVGESGCGKTMTALSLMRLARPPARIVAGEVRFEGRDLLGLDETAMRRLRGGRIAMVFQDPMTFLNPLMRVGEQIAETIRLHQAVAARDVRAIVLGALRRVRIPAPETVIDYYPHQLSGGMRQRVLIAIAIASSPALLIADEPTTALDVTVQSQIMRLLADLRREIGGAMLLITHDLGLVAEYCDRIYVMYAGRIVEEGDVRSIFARPRHPYTRALLRSTLSPTRRVESFESIDGHPPNLIRPPLGCRFHPRCPEAIARCGSAEPAFAASAGGGGARCWLAEEGSHAPAA